MATSVWRRFSNIWVSGDINLRKNAKITRDDQVVEITSATATLGHYTHGLGRLIKLNRAAGIALTLPLATGSGYIFDLVMAVTASGAHTITTSGTDDITGVSVTGQAGTANAWPSGATADTFTMNGSTQGGLEGDRITLTDIGGGLWQIIHHGSATGVEVTPFS